MLTENEGELRLSQDESDSDYEDWVAHTALESCKDGGEFDPACPFLWGKVFDYQDDHLTTDEFLALSDALKNKSADEFKALFLAVTRRVCLLLATNQASKDGPPSYSDDSDDDYDCGAMEPR